MTATLAGSGWPRRYGVIGMCFLAVFIYSSAVSIALLVVNISFALRSDAALCSISIFIRYSLALAGRIRKIRYGPQPRLQSL